MRQILRFLWVGWGATITHYLTVLILVYNWDIYPELANILAFVVAFFISFMGHWRWTFREQQAEFQRALFAFALTALLMFMLNAIIFHLLLDCMGIRFEVSLLIAQGMVAVITYLVSKYWAFARPNSMVSIKH